MKYIIKTISLMCMICVLSLGLFACGEVASKKVYDRYEQISTQNQKMFSEGRLKIDFNEVIINRIQTAGEAKFKKLITIYEPSLQVSLNFYNNNKNYLSQFEESIDLEDSTELNKKLGELESAIASCEDSVEALEYYVNLFEGEDFNQSSILNNKFEVLYTKYDAMVQKAFSFNNYFVKMYTSKYPMFDYRLSTTKLASSDIKTMYDYSLSRILDVAFEVKNESPEYINAILDIYNKYQSYQDLNFTTLMYESNLEKQNEMKNRLAVMQNNLDIYLAQKVNYTNSVAMLKTNLTEVEKAVYDGVMQEFKSQTLASIITSLKGIVDLLEIVE